MMRGFRAALVLAVFLGGCAFGRPSLKPAADEPMFPGLGDRTRPVTTSSPEAQAYFDQGLKFLYGFNHEEAIRSFTRATELDPDCAMAWWGVAMAYGPHINNMIVPPENGEIAYEAASIASERSENGTEVEKALIVAVKARYADPPPADRAALDAAYADAMRGVWQQFPNDPDVGALFAESMMDLRPWNQWSREGIAQPGTEEVISTLESVMVIEPNHPFALHLFIHAVEASPDPGRADDVANRLRDLQPGIGHMVHMPSHIDVRRGRWAEAMTANAKAMQADYVYRKMQPHIGFMGLYMAHDNHMYGYAAMMSGHRADAVRAMDQMVVAMRPDWIRDYTPIADGYSAMPLEVRMRFGMWREIIATPEFPKYYPFARTMRHYARGVAHAAEGHIQSARAEQQAFLRAKAHVPKDMIFGNNMAVDLLAIAEDLLEGEISYREGRVEGGIESMRKAVVHEDALNYDEPPGWIQPVRHALGAALLRSERFTEAEVVFREDLVRLPRNGWGLFGLERSLRGQGRTAEADAVKVELDQVWAGSDVELTTPCFCQPRI